MKKVDKVLWYHYELDNKFYDLINFVGINFCCSFSLS